MQNENGSPKKSLLSAQVDLSKFDSSYFRAATEEEKKQQDVMSESTTFFKDGIRRLKKNPLAMGSLVVLILILVIIIIAPHIVPYSYDQIITVNGVRDKSAKNLGMMEYSPREHQYMEETGEKLFPHIFGTDSLCRDYFIPCYLRNKSQPCSRSGSIDHGIDHRTAIWCDRRILWWKSRYGNDAYRRCHLFPAGYVDDHLTFRCIERNAGTGN